MKITIDIILSILGILLSVTMFIADLPFPDSELPLLLKITVALSPFALLGIYWAWRSLHQSSLFYSITQALATFRLHRALRCESSMTVSIVNINGDAVYKRTYKYYLVKNYELNEIPSESIYSVSELANLKVEAKITNSNINGIKLEPRKIEQPKINMAGVEHFCYRWDYSISPPLQKKKDMIEYQYEILIPGEEIKAFTDGGSQAFFLVRKGFTKNHCFLIAPPQYEIEIIEAFVLNTHGNKVTTDFIAPKLQPNNQVLEWNPKLEIGFRYVIKYRLTRKQ